MRPSDWREVSCQIPENTRPEEAAAWSYAAGRSWVAIERGQPIAAVGIVPISVAVLSIWAWGTKRMWRAVPPITRYVERSLGEEWYRLGVQRVEARSIVGHDAAHRWLRGLGWTETPCPSYGRNGEDFILFAQTRKGWERRNVLPNAQDQSAEHPAGTAA